MPDEPTTPAPAEKTECAYRPSGAAAVQITDGTWKAHWEERDGRGEARQKSKAGFSSEAEALAFARKLELIARLNRC